MNAGCKVDSYSENLQELCPFRVSQNRTGKLLAVYKAFSVGDLGLPGIGDEQLNQRSPLGNVFVSWSGGHRFTIKVWCVLPACARAFVQAFLPEFGNTAYMIFSLWPPFYTDPL